MYGKKVQVGEQTEIGYFADEDFQSIGESLLLAMAQYNMLVKELEKEFASTNGWLKMSKLNDVTGKSAREDVIAPKSYQRVKKSSIEPASK